MSILKYCLSFFTDTTPIHVVPFGGYAGNTTITAQARVLKNHPIWHTENDSPLKNLWNSFKRFESDEKKGVPVRVTFGTTAVTLISDHEGYIYLQHPFRQTVNENGSLWMPITFEILQHNTVVSKVTASILTPSPQASYGVISDLDDTVMHTGVTSILKWRLFVNSLMKHSSKRRPIEGAQLLYDLLSKGKSDKNINPFFYLSNSPWNLYDYLQAFLQKFSFPQGVLLLRDMGFPLTRKPSFTEGNKYKRIVHILETYPSLNFILIGGAAEQDANIYLAIARQFAGRILSIYIRAVDSESKTQQAAKIADANKDINLVLVKETAHAIEHARLCGYIP